MSKKGNISKHPFKTPENYFSKLEENIQQSVQGEFIGEGLKKISKENVFSTPQDYFEDLPSIIQAKVQQRSKSWLPQFDWSPALRLSSLAAVVLIGFFLIQNLNSSVSAEELLSEISNEELIAYLDTEELVEEDIIDMINVDQIPEASGYFKLEVDQSTFDELYTDEDLLDLEEYEDFE